VLWLVLVTIRKGRGWRGWRGGTRSVLAQRVDETRCDGNRTGRAGTGRSDTHRDWAEHADVARPSAPVVSVRHQSARGCRI